MKEPQNWDEEYVFSLLTGEYDWLEAKGSQVIKPETKYVDHDLLSKAVSAIANSGGGTLILGVKQRRTDKKWEVDAGGIDTTIGHTNTREWLEDIISTLVDPPLRTFNVYKILGSTEITQIQPGKAVYIIQIEDSLSAPHQAKDNRYYGRVAGKSQPLSHRMVMDIVNRRQYPLLELKFYYAYADEKPFTVPKEYGQHPILVVSIRNTGTIFAQYVNSIIDIPGRAIDESTISLNYKVMPIILDENNEYLRIIIENIASGMDARGNYSVALPGQYIPILPGREQHWLLPLRPNIFRDVLIRGTFFRTKPSLYWELFADNSPSQKGEILMKDISSLHDVNEIW
jgi:hypothetical protein